MIRTTQTGCVSHPTGYESLSFSKVAFQYLCAYLTVLYAKDAAPSIPDFAKMPTQEARGRHPFAHQASAALCGRLSCHLLNRESP